MTLAQLLLALASPLAKRIFIALGLAWVVYEGVSSAIDSYLAEAAAQMLGLPSEIVQILTMCGIVDGMSLFAGALIARAAMIPLSQVIPDQGQGT